MLKKLIDKVTKGQNLTIDEAREALELITSSDTPDSQIAALLIALRLKGETVDELTGFAAEMRKKASQISYIGTPLYDCCGTGGDMASTINVSTAAAILASAGRVYIAKHSNGSITSKSGSSDVLQELGLPICINEKQVYENLNNYNIAFMHAPSFHQSTKSVARIRQELGTRTIFNILGPLTNPARPTGQLVGVSCPELCPKMAEVLRNLGAKKAMVVCADDPRLDEISISSNTLVYELNEGKITHYELDPFEKFGIEKVNIEAVKGSDPATNAKVIYDIFATNINDARRDLILINTAALLWVADKVECIEEGFNVAEDLLNSGKGFKKILALKEQY